MYNKDILYKMIVLLGIKYINNKKEYYENHQYDYSKNLFDNKKYLEAYCYVLANIDISAFNNVVIHNKEVIKITRRIMQLKEKIYAPEEIALIVSQEFSTR